MSPLRSLCNIAISAILQRSVTLETIAVGNPDDSKTHTVKRTRIYSGRRAAVAARCYGY